jgi:hypothetical protein
MIFAADKPVDVEPWFSVFLSQQIDMWLVWDWEVPIHQPCCFIQNGAGDAYSCARNLEEAVS